MKTKTALAYVRKTLLEIARINSAIFTLQWDSETGMPAAGNVARGATIGYLEGLAHEKVVSRRYASALLALADAPPEDIYDYRMFRRAHDAFERQRKLPTRFVSAHAELRAASHQVWAEARKTSDFKLFLPNFKRLVQMNRERAELIGFEESPYDVLLEDYEPGMRVSTFLPMMETLRARLSSLVRLCADAKDRPDPADARIAMPVEAQKRLNRRVAEALGFDFGAGRLDESTHPFTARLHPGDVRITTRYDEADLCHALYSTIHEVGHGIYEQALPPVWYGTAVGEAPSYGLHESQSRLYENIVGKSAPFVSWLLGLVRAEGYAAKVDDETFFRALNAVTPSLIRTEADEVTYNLHIGVRVDIEVRLIEGKLRPEDVPEAWNAAMKRDLGVTVPDDARGCLQDVHWSHSLFGYFGSYKIGNVYGDMLHKAFAERCQDFHDRYARGEFGVLKTWLYTYVHKDAGLRSAEQLVRHVTDSELDATPFLTRLETKVKDVYRLR